MDIMERGYIVGTYVVVVVVVTKNGLHDVGSSFFPHCLSEYTVG